jgi:predicted phage-related endonuclease
MHYAQMQVYMHLTGMTRALYFAVNKNTDELYTERVKYNKEHAENLMRRAKDIIESEVPLDRCASRPDYYECKYCSATELCWGEK